MCGLQFPVSKLLESQYQNLWMQRLGKIIGQYETLHKNYADNNSEINNINLTSSFGSVSSSALSIEGRLNVIWFWGGKGS